MMNKNLPTFSDLHDLELSFNFYEERQESFMNKSWDELSMSSHIQIGSMISTKNVQQYCLSSVDRYGRNIYNEEETKDACENYEDEQIAILKLDADSLLYKIAPPMRLDHEFSLPIKFVDGLEHGFFSYHAAPFLEKEDDWGQFIEL